MYFENRNEVKFKNPSISLPVEVPPLEFVKDQGLRTRLYRRDDIHAFFQASSPFPRPGRAWVGAYRQSQPA